MRLKKLGVSLYVLLSAALATPAEKNWDSQGRSLYSMGTGAYNIVNPLLLSLPEHLRSQTSDRSVFTSNPSYLGQLYQKRKLQPVVISSQMTGALFGPLDALNSSAVYFEDVVDRLQERPGELQQVKNSVSVERVGKHLGWRMSYDVNRELRYINSAQVDVNFTRDYGVSFGAGSMAFDNPKAGRVDAGTSLKGIFRTGDEITASASSLFGQSLSPASFKKSAVALGLDYGFLYTAPVAWTGNWIVQIGLVWKDLGTTQFLLGPPTSLGGRFKAFPNNQIVSIGAAAPPVSGWRAQVRTEWHHLMRDLPLTEKWNWNFELRMPMLLKTSFGWTMSRRWSAGLGWRFPYFELDMVTYQGVYGEGLWAHSQRYYGAELRHVY